MRHYYLILLFLYLTSCILSLNYDCSIITDMENNLQCDCSISIPSNVRTSQSVSLLCSTNRSHCSSPSLKLNRNQLRIALCTDEQILLINKRGKKEYYINLDQFSCFKSKSGSKCVVSGDGIEEGDKLMLKRKIIRMGPRILGKIKQV
ncbi:hypothetical protein K502DRAFT_364967 [Neoconidiobolus thromboides FSU 785]|nr:hypothetical protein K502DRAFT_364967 [Neoconidiobolus thromboides FSU 785]